MNNRGWAKPLLNVITATNRTQGILCQNLVLATTSEACGLPDMSAARTSSPPQRVRVTETRAVAVCKGCEERLAFLPLEQHVTLKFQGKSLIILYLARACSCMSAAVDTFFVDVYAPPPDPNSFGTIVSTSSCALDD